ncbi:MAG: metal-dependent transcriptional regulator [Bacteroidetes bacterium]|nr:metal-dependent transcriptional regulator [Bacteroidota bacterium]
MQRNTLTEENYLKAIFHLVNEKNEVGVNDISKFLYVKMPSVNNMMKKFAEKKWVIQENYKPIKITKLGKKESALVVRKHRLTEMFLVKKMNFGWETVHEIAEQLEHVHSPIFFDKMDELLGFPTIDPHGEPIPDKDGNIIAQNLKKLSNCEVGNSHTFVAVTNSEDDFLTFLNEKKLQLNQVFNIIKIEKYDLSMTIEVEGRLEILSHIVSRQLLVK